MSLPNFVIAGTARSGTTSLYYYLKQHPDISFSSIKEPKYFSSLQMKFPHRGPGDTLVDGDVIKDRVAYESLFSSLEGAKRIGDASSDILYHHQYTATAISEMLGDIPIVIVLRDPVERAYSAYNNMIRDQRESLSFAQALADEDRRLADNWDWMWAYRSGGLYSSQVATFMDVFTNVKVILFEDLVRTPGLVVKDVFSFLGVDANVTVNTEERYSHSGSVKNPVIRWFMRRDNICAFYLRKTLLKIFPRSLFESILSSVLHKDNLLKQDELILRDSFRADIDKLETLLERDLSFWKTA